MVSNDNKNADVIVIDNVSFRYADSTKYALKNINLKIKQGEVVLVAGRNGAGKSTLCYLLNGLIPHFYTGVLEGSVKVFGIDTRTTSTSYLSTRVGLLFSEPASQLLTASVEDEIAFPLENLGLPVEVINERVSEVLKMLGIEKYRNRSPFTLSGGEQQLVALASVLAMNPDVYVLDEPTSSLDPIGTLTIIEILKKIVHEFKKIFIIVEHKIEEFLELADRLVVIHEGSVVADGKPRQVIQDNIIKLEELGLELPQIALFAHKLLSLFECDDQELKELPFTVEEALTWLSKFISKCRKTRAKEEDRETSRSATSYVAERKTGSDKLAIEVENVSFRYPNTEALVLDNVSLKVHEGEMVALIGHNGSGKTTLAKLIVGLLKPTAGTVKVFGLDTKTTPMNQLIKYVGYVFQDPDRQLFSSKVYSEIAFGLKNLKMPKQLIDKKVREVAKLLGIEHLLNERPYSLSRGDRQKVAIASVLVMDPKIVIFDEPTTGQDPVDRRQIMKIAKWLNESGKTIIFITHDMHLVAEYARRVVVMDHGKIVMDGEPHQVFERVDELKRIRLKPPSVVELFVKLRSAGIIDSPVTPVTVDEALNIFMNQVAKQGG